MTVTLSHIVAAAENDVIGREGGLPWHIPEDLKFFKDKTLGHAIIMGRKTYESVGRPLPKRLNVIVTRQKDYHPEGTAVFPSLAEAIAYCERESATWGEEIFIAGGGEIFEQSMDMVDKIYLTRIHQEIPATPITLKCLWINLRKSSVTSARSPFHSPFSPSKENSCHHLKG